MMVSKLGKAIQENFRPSTPTSSSDQLSVPGGEKLTVTRVSSGPPALDNPDDAETKSLDSKMSYVECMGRIERRALINQAGRLDRAKSNANVYRGGTL